MTVLAVILLTAAQAMPQLVAHRGASAAPENTVAALAIAGAPPPTS